MTSSPGDVVAFVRDWLRASSDLDVNARVRGDFVEAWQRGGGSWWYVERLTSVINRMRTSQ